MKYVNGKILVGGLGVVLCLALAAGACQSRLCETAVPPSRVDCREACRNQALLGFRSPARVAAELDRRGVLSGLVTGCVNACRRSWGHSDVDCVASVQTAAELDKCSGISSEREVLDQDRKAVSTTVLQVVRRAKTSEAIDELDRLYKAASLYYSTPHVDGRTGVRLPCQFPASEKMTPDVTGKRCCGGALDQDKDNRCDVNTIAWTTATWSALMFQLNDQHYFGYEFESSGTGTDAKFTVSAYGDLDCDGVLSTFRRSGTGSLDQDGDCVMRAIPGMETINPTE